MVGSGGSFFRVRFDGGRASVRLPPDQMERFKKKFHKARDPGRLSRQRTWSR